ncbi:hypothetical protein AVEN_228850-1 [Araneus ventricosus]|uniref:Uncharacterized protein n=1 Tax=Araneus ventricosus TaxID=182803 RepID=A0A4Y2R5Z9_ARAVE|nr:hypothetical protein AVEN_228850-1 [Araneus ventricosus]
MKGLSMADDILLLGITIGGTHYHWREVSIPHYYIPGGARPLLLIRWLLIRVLVALTLRKAYKEKQNENPYKVTLRKAYKEKQNENPYKVTLRKAYKEKQNENPYDGINICSLNYN